MTVYWGKQTIYEYLANDIPDGVHTFMTGPTQQIALQVRVLNKYEDTEIASSTYIASSNSSAIDVLKVYGTFSVKPGVSTQVFYGANQGTIIYTTNDFILDGTITRKAAALNVASTVECPNVYLFKNPDNTLEFLPGVGGGGGSAGSGSTTATYYTYYGNGGNGGAGNTLASKYYRGAGGGAGGGLAYRKTESGWTYSYAGHRGNSYGGGCAGRGDYNNGIYGITYGGGSLGGGNLTIYCDGDFLVGDTGYIDVSGGDVASYRSYYHYHSGYGTRTMYYDGGGGGGAVNIFYQGNINGTEATNIAKLTVRGGTVTRYNDTSYAHALGGTGGTGRAVMQKMGAITKDRILILDENMLRIEGVNLGRVIQGSYTKSKRIYLENRYYQTVQTVKLTWDYNENSEDKEAILEFSLDGVNFTTDRTITFNSPLQPGKKHILFVRGLSTPTQIYDTNFDFDIEVTA